MATMELGNGAPGPFAKLRATRCAQPIIVCPVACEAAARPYGSLTQVTLCTDALRLWLRGGGLDDLDADSEPLDEGPAPASPCAADLRADGASAAALMASAHGPARVLHSPMTLRTVGSAAPGLFFDVEAVGGDVLVSGIEAATEERGPVEFAVYACDGSWLDKGFQKMQTRSAWTCVMYPKVLRLHSNEVELLDDGNIRLQVGGFSPLPLDDTITVQQGQRRGIYIHGREPGAVQFRHPVWDLEWKPGDVVEHGMIVRHGEDNPAAIVQYAYSNGMDGHASTCMTSDDDGYIRVYAGTPVWDVTPFGVFDPIEEQEAPDDHDAAAFCGRIIYHARPK